MCVELVKHLEIDRRLCLEQIAVLLYVVPACYVQREVAERREINLHLFLNAIDRRRQIAEYVHRLSHLLRRCAVSQSDIQLDAARRFSRYVRQIAVGCLVVRYHHQLSGICPELRASYSHVLDISCRTVYGYQFAYLERTVEKYHYAGEDILGCVLSGKGYRHSSDTQTGYQCADIDSRVIEGGYHAYAPYNERRHFLNQAERMLVHP